MTPYNLAGEQETAERAEEEPRESSGKRDAQQVQVDLALPLVHPIFSHPCLAFVLLRFCVEFTRFRWSCWSGIVRRSVLALISGSFLRSSPPKLQHRFTALFTTESPTPHIYNSLSPFHRRQSIRKGHPVLSHLRWCSLSRIHNTSRIYDLIDNWVWQELFYDKLRNVSRTQQNIQVVTILGCALVALGFLLIRHLLLDIIASPSTTSLPQHSFAFGSPPDLFNQPIVSNSVNEARSNPTLTRPVPTSLSPKPISLQECLQQIRSSESQKDGRTPLCLLGCYLPQGQD
ncbi:hypothetical protein C8J56DRAFT_1169522 [Mycena floridula]|nr:hypothetical protein C8J56DRAFT_1169522 [Mycena floridula]